MSTLYLIRQAEADRTAASTSTAAAAASAKALHDDLAANGPTVVLGTDSPQVTIYEPSEPDSWFSTVVRVAQ